MFTALSSGQVVVKLVFSHRNAGQRTQDRQAQQSQEDRTEGIHIRIQHAQSPGLRELANLIQAVAETSNNLGGVFATAEPRPKTNLQGVLEYRRGNGDPDGAAGAPECVRSRCNHRVVLMVNSRDQRDQSNGQHAAICCPRQEEVQEWQPGWRGESERRDQPDRCDLQCHDNVVEDHVATTSPHDEPAPQRANRGANGLWYQSDSGCGGRQALHLEVEWEIEEQAKGRHGGEPVCQASRGHGPIEEKSHRDDRLGCDTSLDIDENAEEDRGQRQGRENDWVRPWHLISTSVETEQQCDEGDHQGNGAEEVNTLDPSLVGLLDWDFHLPCDQNTRDHHEGDLNQECPSPSQGIIDPATKDTSETHPSAKADVSNALPDASLAQRNQIRRHERRDGRETAATDAGYNSA